MRSSTEASLAPWPMRILRPWLLASAAGLLIGTLLLQFDSGSAPLEESDYTPRAAVYNSGPALVPDPFAPAASLAAPPDAGPSAADAPAPEVRALPASAELIAPAP